MLTLQSRISIEEKVPYSPQHLFKFLTFYILIQYKHMLATTVRDIHPLEEEVHPSNLISFLTKKMLK
jgi:hypothetical protein